MAENGFSSSSISAEDVIGKLKDEGDFDKLRLKIIRKLKENEELRESITSAVKQSAAINRVGAENLKPRQLSDAIQEEIGEALMGQISDGLWEVIRSSDGMQSEIKEAVESVYNRLLSPNEKESDQISAPVVNTESVHDREVILSHREPINPLCISEENNQNYSHNMENINHYDGGNMNYNMNLDKDMNEDSDKGYRENHSEVTMQLKVPKKEPCISSNNDPDVPPGFAPSTNTENPHYISDDDPDVPPGFG